MFFGMGGATRARRGMGQLGFDIPGAEYTPSSGEVFGTVASNNSGGGWSWAGDLANIINAGGSAVERVAGAITGHQGQYTATQQRFQPIQQPVIYQQPGGGELSLDRTFGDITRFLSRNILPVGLFVVGVMLFRSGRK